MRRVLATAVLVACLPTAYAQDKAKGEFTHGGEYRVRDTWMQNAAGGDKSQTNSQNTIYHRFKLGIGARASEKLSAHLTLLGNATFGQISGETQAEYSGATGGTEENFAAINEMYANWLLADDLAVKLGRFNYQIGDGYVIGINDWEATPYSFEGVLGSWEAEFGRLQAFAFKLREYATAGPTSGDPEHNTYGLNFDLKTMPEWLKAVNVHVLQDAAQIATAGTTGTTVKGTQGQDVLRYGANAGFAFSIVDLKLWYAGYNGKIRNSSGSLDTEGTMMQAELGVGFPGFMNSRVYAQYHQDSGDKNSTDNKNGRYDSYFYERHDNAGLMDLFDWGNLTYITVGWTGKPSDATDVGLTYTMFSRTEKGDGVASGLYGGQLNAATTFGSDDKLGDEIDLWAEHRYENGLSTVARVGYFMPGGYYDKATPDKRGDDVLQVMVQGKFAF
ncbi:MAG: alginate export family protein [Calothrix sp. SM1_5_4]|nr:alginate export family protein [Calothrix sp. SM1_5_4]